MHRVMISYWPPCTLEHEIMRTKMRWWAEWNAMWVAFWNPYAKVRVTS